MIAAKAKLKRQRARNSSFDLNRSSPQVKEKYVKSNQQGRIPQPMENNIIDMSETIKTDKSTGAIPKTREKVDERMESQEELPHSVKQMVMESVEVMRRELHHSIRDIVNENLNMQLNRVQQSIALLNESIRGLSMSNQIRQNASLPGENVADERHGTPEVRQNPASHGPANPLLVVPPREPNLPVAMNVPPLQYYGNRTRVERFRLNFNGNETHLSVESFVFRLEHCQRQYQIP